MALREIFVDFKVGRSMVLLLLVALSYVGIVLVILLTVLFVGCIATPMGSVAPVISATPVGSVSAVFCLYQY